MSTELIFSGACLYRDGPSTSRAVAAEQSCSVAVVVRGSAVPSSADRGCLAPSCGARQGEAIPVLLEEQMPACTPRTARGCVAACGLVSARAGVQLVLFEANPPRVVLFCAPVVEKEAPLILAVPQLRAMMLCPIDHERVLCSSRAGTALHVQPHANLV